MFLPAVHAHAAAAVHTIFSSSTILPFFPRPRIGPEPFSPLEAQAARATSEAKRLLTALAQHVTVLRKPQRPMPNASRVAALRPTPGWKPRQPVTTGAAFVNPRAPSVPVTLDINLEEYYAGCALVGLLSSQGTEPEHEWASEWAIKQGVIMAAKVRERRETKRSSST